MAVSAITLVFSLSSCGGDKNAQRIKDATMNLDQTTHTLPGYDYWPECGLRVMGSHLASLISLDEFQKMLPCPLYVSGPHQNGKWDLQNENDFGHYNPQAIQYLANLFKKVVADKQFVETSKPLVDKYLYDKLLIMMVLHDAMYDPSIPAMLNFDGDPQQVRNDILSEIVENHGFCYDISCQYQYAIFIDVPSWTGNGSTEHFLYFWARRWKDGTIDQFYDCLSTVFKAYHPEYEFHLEDYWRDEEFLYEWEEDYEGDGFTETYYDIELETNEPVLESERIKEDDAVKMIRDAVGNLENTRNVMPDEFDYWPECGLRNTASHLFSLIQLRTLQRMLPCELYVSGPHQHNCWEMNCTYSFGHYNPEAVQYLGDLAKKTVSDKKFVERTKPLVDQYLKRQMRILMMLYDGLNDSEIYDKQAVLDNAMEYEGHLNGTTAGGFLYSLYDDIEDGSFVYANTGEMFLYWWARRDYDGTMELFHDALETVYSAYYPAAGNPGK